MNKQFRGVFFGKAAASQVSALDQCIAPIKEQINALEALVRNNNERAVVKGDEINRLKDEVTALLYESDKAREIANNLRGIANA